MDKYLQNMKLFHILLISCLNLKALLASICLKKDDVAFQIKGFLDKRIEGCGIQQVPKHLHYTYKIHIQLQCTKSLCVPSPAASLPSSTAPPSPDSRLTGSRLAPTPSGGRCEDRCLSIQCWDMTHGPWQGVLVYSRPVGWAELGAGQQEGVYIYPDWAACVRGVWANHTLVQGRSLPG